MAGESELLERFQNPILSDFQTFVSLSSHLASAAVLPEKFEVEQRE